MLFNTGSQLFEDPRSARLLGLTCVVILLTSLCSFSALSSAQNYSIPSTKASSTLLLDIAVAGERLVAVGQRGHIIYSDDAAKTWVQAKVPSRVLLTSVFFLNPTVGWAVGHESTILATTDGGSTWTIQNATPYDPAADDGAPMGRGEPLFDVWFSDEKNGIAVGAFAYVLKTQDGGLSWTDATTDIDNLDGSHYYFLTADQQGSLWLGGEMGNLFVSNDLGKSWNQVQSPYSGSFFGLVSSPTHVYVFGLQGQIHRSSNTGKDWEKASSQTQENINGGLVISSEKIVLVGNKGAVLLSNDGGETFAMQKGGSRFTWLGVASSSQRIIAVGESGAAVCCDSVSAKGEAE